MPIFANVGGSTGYWLVFMTLIVLGWFSGIVQSCLYQENAKLPGRYIGIFLTSQGLGGIFTNIFRFCTLKIWPDSPFISASACYLIAVLVCLLCIPAQINMKKNSFAQYYQNKTINLEVQPQPQTVFIVPMEVQEIANANYDLGNTEGSVLLTRSTNNPSVLGEEQKSSSETNNTVR